MRWEKTGRIFNVDGQAPWMTSHAQVPIPQMLASGRLRIYFSTRDAEGRSRPAFVEVDPDEPSRVLAVAAGLPR